jgi:transposase InsO family protein
MSMRREFVMLARQEGANRRALCRRYGISPTTAYKWLARAAQPEEPFQDRSRRPRHSPKRTPADMEQAVLRLRDQHPAWGGRKIARRLADLGHSEGPSPSTVTQILRRHDRLDAAESARHTPWQRFAREVPNALWQMDFKGHFALVRGRCHPLGVLDDCARFALALEACADECAATVQACLTGVFRRYGLPAVLLADNGGPWGGGAAREHTQLGVWLMRLGIGLHHGRPYHPQTQGKEERFHRTLAAEVITGRGLCDLAQAQRAFDAWRQVYNCERPHEALDLDVPAQHYRPSQRASPEVLPAIEYAEGAIRKVQAGGLISFANRNWRVGKALIGYPVAVRPTTTDGVYEVFFCHERLTQIDLGEAP